mmetsp:Transcript_761/g.2744  ORF Transcript_761/g.2744 Transcript_761/m.2744 type:complete len:238 (+) Transcript_761:692-1405(+)
MQSLRTQLQAGRVASTRTRASRTVRSVAVNAAARPLWNPGSTPPDYLDGTLPGDYGFDPLGLGSDPELLKWFQQAELQHCRWAMLGNVGILVPEILSKTGVADLPIWAKAGEADYGVNFLTLFWTQMFLMNWAEVRRWQDIKKPGSMNVDPLFGGDYKCTGTEVGYPGGKWFDPLDFASTDKMEINKVKEVKNGRLAMVAFVGYATQYFVTGKGPVDNWITHVSDPSHNTLFQQVGL